MPRICFDQTISTAASVNCLVFVLGCSAHQLAEGVDDDAARRQALHALVLLPEADVILEGQEVKHAVEHADSHCECQQVGVALQEDALHLQQQPQHNHM